MIVSKTEFKQLLNKINMSVLWDIVPVPLVIILLMCVLFFTGCSSPQSQAVKVVTQQVYVPKIVYCLDRKDVPVYSEIVKTKINKSDNNFVKVKKLIVRDNENKQFINLVVPLLEGCSKD